MGQHRRRMGRRRRDLQRMIIEQQEYIALCERQLSRISDERDRLLSQCWMNGSEDPTVIAPTVLEPPTQPIPIVLPNGTVVRTVIGQKKLKVNERRTRPSWARKD